MRCLQRREPMTWQSWTIFVLASLPIHFAPGPNNILSLRNGGLSGVRHAVLAMFARLPGYSLIFLMSGLGLATLLMAYPGLLSGLKVAGGIYLAWVGLSTLRNAQNVAPELAHGQQVFAALAREEFITAISNPKAILFATAFYAQFLQPGQADYAAQYLTLVSVSLSLESIAGASFAFAGALFAHTMNESRALPWLTRGCGTLLCGVGLLLGMEGAGELVAETVSALQNASL